MLRWARGGGSTSPCFHGVCQGGSVAVGTRYKIQDIYYFHSLYISNNNTLTTYIDILVEIGEQHNHIRVVFLLPPDNIKITYIDTERKRNEQRIMYHALHVAKITRHGVLEENIGSQWTRKHEYMFCFGYDTYDSQNIASYDTLLLKHNVLCK